MTNVSKKLARTAAVGIWSIASMALAGQAKTSAPGCFEGGAQGKAVPTAKTQEDCQKLGEKFTWMEAAAHDHDKGHDHKAQSGKVKGKVKQQAKTEAKSEVKPAAATEATPAVQPEVQATPATEAPKK
ncbi:MAG TPA: hypothetical protein VE954_43505 [Oligoflexus sp.]|uniref:hypothetical protein n=1 Tax=Oligoflexus sp. TaxID=1971216 RepID=UPI002D474780|nr:hypothetical protein [Oligoflexus sp.]HYX40012.1 hypothetical protein [Oligoflexus sp.]